MYSILFHYFKIISQCEILYIYLQRQTGKGVPEAHADVLVPPTVYSALAIGPCPWRHQLYCRCAMQRVSVCQ